ncbi:hypothetical protein RJJ65_30795 [Rhizobium hidalgonense]|uniref:Uncharacterized protein n=1 Tax=Rhizobium hidalgonense TaxID=1538159 RepID=A0AAJ2H126_9HYPH|nr:hypothetical protein [Rhizobium hidalgonense]EJC75287.1 hypothetical protein Rleg10DRAFT_3888 [Rhizobium leguminosarum bv. trifolii WSM2012]EJC76430.1 hypothetical protein Rleg10DRAFT_5083 [Rhizobium leguminosarum bv. trifolii WSM2012]MDR9776959.1 hypothetical protein [Rhizobium hidalgonense]MDR9813989.1 hypothetical protein [Rhizobium hidalgonense]MDR9820693.1 hypothetical protein [Rhizobium hidalgonense]
MPTNRAWPHWFPATERQAKTPRCRYAAEEMSEEGYEDHGVSEKEAEGRA